jgi:hypothetical protein
MTNIRTWRVSVRALRIAALCAAMGAMAGTASGAVTDLSILDIEVTQAIQCLDTSEGYTSCPDNDLGLSDYRETVVRVYVGHVGGAACPAGDPYSPVVNNVTVKLRWLLSPPSTLYSEKTVSFDVPCSTSLGVLRKDAKGSADFVFSRQETGKKPGEIKDFDLEAEVVPPAAMPDNPSNNTGTESVQLNPRQPLDIAWIPVWYKPTNPVWPAPSNEFPEDSVIRQATGLIKSTYPVPVHYRTPGFMLKYTGPDIRTDDQGYSNKLLIQLAYVRASMKPMPDALIGWLPKGANVASGVIGLGTNVGNVAWAVQEKSDKQNQVSLAHEIGHTQGIDHVNEIGCPSEIGEAGFAVGKETAYPGTTNDWMRGHAYDGWVSPYVWNRLLGIGSNFNPDCPSPTMTDGIVTDIEAASSWMGAPQPAIQVSGIVTAAGTGSIDPIYRVVTDGPFPTSSPSGAYCIDLESSTGGTLSSHCFDAGFREVCGDHAPITEDGFFFQLPLPAGTTRVVLRHSSADSVLAERSITEHSPEVTILSPAGGVWTGTVAWTASDDDGDPLQYNVLYSRDGGSSWMPLGVQVEATTLTVDPSLLAGSTAAVIRVVATDGFNTGMAESAQFAVPKKAPHAYITTPGNNQRFRSVDTLSLVGGAQDLEDGELSGTHLVWTSGAVSLGTGQHLTLPASMLGPGSHTITLTATDTDLQADSTAIAVHVNDAAVEAECTPNDEAKLLIAGEPLVVKLKYLNGMGSPVQFTSTINTNVFFGPQHTFDTFTNPGWPGEVLGVVRGYDLDTSTFSPAEDRILIEIVSDASGPGVLAVCDFMLTINSPPVADAGGDATVECPEVTLDGTGSWDMDGHPVSCTWNADTCAIADPHECLTTASCPVGDHVASLVVSDGLEESAPDPVTITVVDTTPPELTLPAPLQLECNTTGGVSGDDPAISSWLASFSASDACGTATTEWSAPDFFDAGCDPQTGTAVVTFTATDDQGNAATGTSTVTVLDSTPPVIDVASVNGACLWSPDHEFRTVAVFEVSDVCDPDATNDVWADVTSDEATASEAGAGGPSHCPDALLDWAVVTGGAGSVPRNLAALQLRAERAGPDGTDNGRVYGTAGVGARDRCGNAGVAGLPTGTVPGCPGAVCVPHDTKKKPGRRCPAIDDGQSHDASVCN